MAFLVIELDVTNQSVTEINELMKGPGKGRETVNALINELAGVLTGSNMASVQVTSRTTTAGVTASGTDSQQQSFDLK